MDVLAHKGSVYIFSGRRTKIFGEISNEHELSLISDFSLCSDFKENNLIL